MKLISINVGKPRLVEWNGMAVSTGIFKSPVKHRVRVRTLNIDGDEQADLNVHGGISKAVYAYPMEHYEFWRNEYPDMELPWGMFGENLTVEGLSEAEVNIGDRLRFGSVELEVTEPRMPCFKLGIKFGRMDVIKRFLQSERTGIYFSVIREGDLAAGDSIEWTHREAHKVSVADLARLHTRDKTDMDSMRRALQIEALPQEWRERFWDRLTPDAG